DHDLTGGYHNASPSAIYGPSGINNLFNPGSFKGDPNPEITQRPRPFDSWNVSPQPAVGIAWNPHGGDGWMGTLLGGRRTVLRVRTELTLISSSHTPSHGTSEFKGNLVIRVRWRCVMSVTARCGNGCTRTLMRSIFFSPVRMVS